MCVYVCACVQACVSVCVPSCTCINVCTYVMPSVHLNVCKQQAHHYHVLVSEHITSDWHISSLSVCVYSAVSRFQVPIYHLTITHMIAVLKMVHFHVLIHYSFTVFTWCLAAICMCQCTDTEWWNYWMYVRTYVRTYLPTYGVLCLVSKSVDKLNAQIRYPPFTTTPIERLSCGPIGLCWWKP